MQNPEKIKVQESVKNHPMPGVPLTCLGYYLLCHASLCPCPLWTGLGSVYTTLQAFWSGPWAGMQHQPTSIPRNPHWLLAFPPGAPVGHPVPHPQPSPSTNVHSQASLRVCVTSSSASETTSPSRPPSRMATCSSGTFGGLTAVSECSQPTMGLYSAVTGTPRTGVGWGPGQRGRVGGLVEGLSDCLKTCETEWGALPPRKRSLRTSWAFPRGWLATGGRDKMVKVWDMATHRAKEVHCVQTIASVARVKWRPECRHHLATCSMMVDHNVYVWDVRRPFVPAAMFEEHRDVTTGIAWRHPHDPSFLLSGSKDSTLCQHLFRDASQPVERANPEGLCYGLFGDLAFAAKESLVATESGRKPYAGDRRHPIFFKRKLDPAEPFAGLASSALNVFEIEPGSGSMSWFVDTAERYALAGRPLAELCDHNAKVARELGRNQVHRVG